MSQEDPPFEERNDLPPGLFKRQPKPKQIAIPEPEPEQEVESEQEQDGESEQESTKTSVVEPAKPIPLKAAFGPDKQPAKKSEKVKPLYAKKTRPLLKNFKVTLSAQDQQYTWDCIALDWNHAARLAEGEVSLPNGQLRAYVSLIELVSEVNREQMIDVLSQARTSNMSKEAIKNKIALEGFRGYRHYGEEELKEEFAKFCEALYSGI